MLLNVKMLCLRVRPVRESRGMTDDAVGEGK